jgi:phage tail-like protein
MPETGTQPFTAFNFAVEIEVQGIGPMLCNAAFSECDGLDMSMEVKTIREGGNNGRQIRMAGPVSYGNVTLKRGMTSSFDLWEWFDAVVHSPPGELRAGMRGEVKVVIKSADQQDRVTFLLERCLPVKLKAPALNAKDGMVAVEELQLAYESLTVRKPQGGAGA